MIRLGPGGTSGLGYESAIQKIANLGLSALEVEFTYGVRMSNSQALEIGILARKHNLALSVHAPYYINLASKESEKQKASIKRILDSCERAHYLGATHVVYHSGFFQGQDQNVVRDKIVKNTLLIQEKIKEKGWNVKLAPELTGKPSQYGSMSELLDLRDATGCDVTIDFAHEVARNKGKIDYADVFDKIKLRHIHSHFSGITWTDKGEKSHKLTEEKDMLKLAQEIVKRKVDITIINESPDPIGDAAKMKEVFSALDEG